MPSTDRAAPATFYGGRVVHNAFGDSMRNRPFQRRVSFVFEEATKVEQRARVLGFLVAEHQARQFRYLGFPGLLWAFEHALVDAVGLEKCRFRGLEASWTILERSVPWMPGRVPKYFQEELDIGDVHGFKTTHASVLFAHAESWFSLRGIDHKGATDGPTLRQHKKAKERFRSLYSNNTLLWIDLTSNLSRDTKRTLRWTFSQCDPRVRRVPVVVTLVYGREQDGTGGIEQRERMIEACFNANKWREFEPQQRWFYHSTNGGRMATWAGVLKAKIRYCI